MLDGDYLIKLAERLVALDERAYEEFAELFGPRFLRYFVRHQLPYFEAEDLAATCVTDIALKASKFRPDEGTFSSWAFAIARNAFIDQYKKAKRTSDAIREMDWDKSEDLSSDVEIAVEVNAALAGLSEIDRTLVERRALGKEHSFKDLADELHLSSEEAARVRHLRAKRRLESRLAVTPAIQSKLKRERGRESRKSA